jgi:putative ABC transport system permease protein
VNSRASMVIGVMPPDMKFPFNNDLWLPLSQLSPEVINAKRGVRNFQVIGRLAPGVTIAQADAELKPIVNRLAHDFPETNKDLRPALMTYNERVSNGPIRVVILSLMGAVGFVLLIACANVANLLLARSAQRSREIAVRVSLGASRWRIVRQLLVESIVLAIVSGILGLGLSVIGIRMFDATVGDPAIGKPYWMTFTMDPLVVAFFVSVCIGTGMLFGLAPALHVSKTDVNEVIKEGGGRSGTGGMRARRWTGTLIVVEVVLTLVLLAGAGFMMRSFLALYRLDLGIETSHLLTMNVQLPARKFPTAEQRTAFYHRLDERLGALGVIRAGTIASAPPLGGGTSRQLAVAGRPAPAGERPPQVTMLVVGPRYFETLGVQLARGRPFADTDGTVGHEVAIVNQRFATMYFAGEDPLGKRVKLTTEAPASPEPAWITIVGVAPTIRQRSMNDIDPDAVMYLPYRAQSSSFMTLLVRTHGDPGAMTSALREEVRALDPDLPLFAIRTLDESLTRARWPFRVFGSMFGIFALIALVLSAVGLYAVTAYSVAQRTQEIGVRMALGAQPSQVRWLILRRAFVQLSVGLSVGLAGAFGVGALLKSLLVQTGSRDPITLGSIALLLVMVSIVASFVPARRATRLDPLVALRYE